MYLVLCLMSMSLGGVNIETLAFVMGILRSSMNIAYEKLGIFS